jgi:type VI secretion system protein VasG
VRANYRRSGARNIDSLLDQQILPALSRELLFRMTRRVASKVLACIRLSYCEDEGIIVELDEAAEVTA